MNLTEEERLEIATRALEFYANPTSYEGPTVKATPNEPYLAKVVWEVPIAVAKKALAEIAVTHEQNRGNEVRQSSVWDANS